MYSQYVRVWRRLCVFVCMCALSVVCTDKNLRFIIYLRVRRRICNENVERIFIKRPHVTRARSA